MTPLSAFSNPFRPGAGHPPPYLAGRDEETAEFRRLLEQKAILENLILTGLRGVGKTVLLDELKPVALGAGWNWVGADLSESTSTTEERLAQRLLADLSVITSEITVGSREQRLIGFGREPRAVERRLDFSLLRAIYEDTPGLVADKLKHLLEIVWRVLRDSRPRGVIFAYDEAQNMADHAAKEEYPLSVLLDVFQSTQKKSIPFMLVLTGLPTLFPKLVEARTYSERMFRVVLVERLSRADSRDAITKPIMDSNCPVKLTEQSIETIIDMSAGYPYFIQFICREVFDAFVQGQSEVPVDAIHWKLDADFFAGRWARATDRQRELLRVIASLRSSEEEFTVAEVVEGSRRLLSKPFSASHANQMLASLSNAGLVYKNRHGRYCFAVPLLSAYIKRLVEEGG